MTDVPPKDDLMLISYAYDAQSPRFYSKYFAAQNDYMFDLPVDQVV